MATVPGMYEVKLKHKMGRSPIKGYYAYCFGDYIALDEDEGGYMRTNTIRLPVEPEDLAAVIRALIKHCKAPLSLQALLVEQEKVG